METGGLLVGVGDRQQLRLTVQATRERNAPRRAVFTKSVGQDHRGVLMPVLWQPSAYATTFI